MATNVLSVAKYERAAQSVMAGYAWTVSVTSMLNDLQWPTLTAGHGAQRSAR